MSQTQDELQAQIEALRSQNEKLKAQNEARTKLSCRVSAKGAVSVYGMGRFPVTLYAEQWKRLAGFIKDGTVEQFIDEHQSELSFKE